MLFDYRVAGDVPSRAVVWSRGPLQPLAGDTLTPLSASVLVELLRRAWFAYYDRVGFAPTPMTRAARMHAGRVYLNLSVAAQLDAEQAGLEPIVLHVNGQALPLATLEKPGFLAGFKLRGKRKQVEQLAATLLQELPAVTQKAESWCAKALEMRWSQAEVLQVMEEIERIGAESMAIFLAARLNLERLTHGILRQLPAVQPDAVTGHILLLNNALSDLRELVEVEIANAVVDLAQQFAAKPDAAAWFSSCEARHWQEDDPGRTVQAGLDEFLNRFGHRALNEGELAHARWHEEWDPILRAIHGCIKYEIAPPSKIPAANALRHLLEAVTGDRDQVARDIQQIRLWQRVQSGALHALAYVWTGTRRWALAAAKEAGADGRVPQPDDIFFFELEEIKQMMTGEWNISDLERIHAVCAQRKLDFAGWKTQEPGTLLLGDDVEGAVSAAALGVVAGHAVGPLHHWRATRKNGCDDAIAASDTLDSGWALVLPVVHGAVSRNGSPLDPFVGAARVWHRPTVVGLGSRYDELVEGAQTTVNGEQAAVEQ